MGKVFRENDKMLRRQGVGNQMFLSVQVAGDCEKDVPLDCVLVFCQFRDALAKKWELPREVILRCQAGKLPISLMQQQLGKLYPDLPVEHMLVAKYVPSTKSFCHLVERDQSALPAAQRVEVNLRVGPYFLSDGDTLVVMDVRQDPDKQDIISDAVASAIESDEARRRRNALYRQADGPEQGLHIIYQ